MKTVFVIVVSLLLMSGCRSRDDVAYDEALSRFREVRDDINAGGIGIRPLNEAGSIMDGWISCVSNASLRAKLSHELSQIVLSVDLTNQPFRAVGAAAKRSFPREWVTGDYPRYIAAVCWIMKKNGCPPELEMDFFFKALQKFRDACFSVPLAFWPLPGEDLELNIARTTAARNLYSDYDYVMSYIRRFVLPELSKHLPPELHDEFKRRIEPFFDYPSKEEFDEMMHPRPKSLPASTENPSMTDSKTKDDADIDVDVELPEDAAKESKQ